MNMRVTEDAADDLENIKARNACDASAGAERVVEQIRTAFRVLGQFQLPHLGHDGTTLTGGRLTVPIRQRCSSAAGAAPKNTFGLEASLR
jgi:plasmid stabilization system protein ParE